MLRKRCALLAAVAGLIMIFGACERKITLVEGEDSQPLSCFDCHNDQNTFLIAAHKQWENSFHASGFNTDRNDAPCSGCHTSEGFLARAQGGSAGSYPNATVIHCFTCHAPHTNSSAGLSGGGFALRITAPQMLQNGFSYDVGAANICAACHQALQNVDTYVRTSNDSVSFGGSTHWGPHHGVQGDNLFGSNGYTYQGYTYAQTNHKDNDDGCLSCHFDITQNFVVGGHSFNMRGTIGTHDDPEEVVNQDACAQCHSMTGVDDFDLFGRQTRIQTLSDSLETILVNAGLLVNQHNVAGVTTSSDSAGAVWNWLMVHEDRSVGIHNYNWLRGLLESSIQFMEGNLPQSSSPPAEADAPNPRPRGAHG